MLVKYVSLQYNCKPWIRVTNYYNAYFNRKNVKYEWDKQINIFTVKEGGRYQIIVWVFLFWFQVLFMAFQLIIYMGKAKRNSTLINGLYNATKQYRWDFVQYLISHYVTRSLGLKIFLSSFLLFHFKECLPTNVYVKVTNTEPCIKL